MIPELPNSVTDIEKLEFYSNMLSNLEDQSTIHTNWHTHKQNPSVCWICDIPIIARKIAYLVEKNITKSALDMETELSSGMESDSEIDDDSLNINEEECRTPEYDVEEDAMDSISSGESE